MGRYASDPGRDGTYPYRAASELHTTESRWPPSFVSNARNIATVPSPPRRRERTGLSWVAMELRPSPCGSKARPKKFEKVLRLGVPSWHQL